MTKPYSNKALPSGTILREWRLEEVLGVGGFGIVYKGRGIYFDEFVAIKEYFPSAISERDEEATVVPIDSEAEEVHALGLKKFVEEAKLLWNLSTPSRHPNIVSVRSLFEIHGTAYMVMDFEDGEPLSEILKRGESFDEEKLRRMVLPVVSGLERAHRVGVLHRDIKPSNILITESGQPVLIDFGSARFETEGVTSTTVTFHTPPYAAIEQYVKTYEQGPWTDIYALGVVLYRCITGEKPAEVLERLHGEQEPPLAEGNWPGYSREFLAAVDAAMIIKPSDRPRSLPEWLAMFEKSGAAAPVVANSAADEDDDATRIAPMAKSVEEIRPKGSDTGDKAAKADAKPVEPKTGKPASGKEAEKTPAAQARSEGKPEQSESPSPQQSGKAPPPPPLKQASTGSLSKPVLIGGGIGVLAIAGLAMAFVSRGGDDTNSEEPAAIAAEISHDDGFGPALLKLAELARVNKIEAGIVTKLEEQAQSIASLETENSALAEDPSRASDMSFNRLRIAEMTRESLGELASGLSGQMDRKTRELVSAASWADPNRPGSAAKESATLKDRAAKVEATYRAARQSIDDLKQADTAEKAVSLTQKAVLAVADYEAATAQALKDNPRKPKPTETSSVAVVATSAPAPVATSSQPASTRSIEQIRAELDRVSDATENQANEVIRLARVREPGGSASEDAKKAYRTLEANADAARDYKRYLTNLERSMRNAKSPAEAEQLLAQGRQTSQYVNAMIQSSRASRAILNQ